MRRGTVVAIRIVGTDVDGKQIELSDGSTSVTVEEDNAMRARLTPAQKRTMQRRHLDDLDAIASDLQRALTAIDLLIQDDVIDNDDFHDACAVESDLQAAAMAVDEFTAYRRALAPRLRLCAPPQLELPGLEGTLPQEPGSAALRVVRCLKD